MHRRSSFYYFGYIRRQTDIRIYEVNSHKRFYENREAGRISTSLFAWLLCMVKSLSSHTMIYYKFKTSQPTTCPSSRVTFITNRI